MAPTPACGETAVPGALAGARIGRATGVPHDWQNAESPASAAPHFEQNTVGLHTLAKRFFCCAYSLTSPRPKGKNLFATFALELLQEFLCLGASLARRGVKQDAGLVAIANHSLSIQIHF